MITVSVLVVVRDASEKWIPPATLSPIDRKPSSVPAEPAAARTTRTTVNDATAGNVGVRNTECQRAVRNSMTPSGSIAVAANFHRLGIRHDLHTG